MIFQSLKKTMRLLSIYFVFFGLILCSFYYESTADESTCGNWLSYKDEKCYKIVDDTFRTFDEALKSCIALDSESTLPIIHSADEQTFLSNYLFKTLKKVENFWIGAKVSPNSTIQWIDSSAMGYVNWDTKGPRNKVNYCVEMQADESAIGKWLDEPCEKKNLVVCQKGQTWSLAHLQKTLLDARQELRQSIDELKKNSVPTIPIGFIYIQLPNQPEPKSMWPTLEWKVVSSEYSGHFFRVEGGNAVTFGQSQSDAFQGHLYSYRYNHNRIFKSGTDFVASWIDESESANTKVRNTQNPISDGINGEPRTANETRPINYSVRIWKRIS